MRRAWSAWGTIYCLRRKFPDPMFETKQRWRGRMNREPMLPHPSQPKAFRRSRVILAVVSRQTCRIWMAGDCPTVESRLGDIWGVTRGGKNRMSVGVETGLTQWIWSERRAQAHATPSKPTEGDLVILGDSCGRIARNVQEMKG